jgi:hypothetical protein
LWKGGATYLLFPYEMTKETLTNAVVPLRYSQTFARFERFTAGVCMAIPFYLLIADEVYAGQRQWMLFFPIIITLLPLGIPIILRSGRDPKNDGLKVTLLGAVTLSCAYLLFTDVLRLESRPSISDYVAMHNSFVFGTLLTMAAMLFLASAFAYWNMNATPDGEVWRSWVNVAQGILLLGVVIFPVTQMHGAHMFFAITFFLACGISSIRRPAKGAKKTQHRIVDYVTVLIMAAAMGIHFTCAWLDIHTGVCDYVNLFGAESIALWVIGIDFILVSLKRES